MDGGMWGAERAKIALSKMHYTRADCEPMPEWKLDLLLQDYGLTLPLVGNVDQKSMFAIEAFLMA